MRHSGRAVAALVAIAALSSSSRSITAQEIQEQQLEEPQSAASDPASAAERTDRWFVELSSAPVADGTALSQVRGEKTAFRRAAAQAGIRFEERHAFDTLWNGLSIRVDPRLVGRLSRLDGVKAVYPVVTVSLPPVEVETSPELFTALGHTGADIAQNELGLSGAGIKVAVMDTGIDYDNPDLGGCFGTGCRVAYGHDFVGDAYNNDSSSPDYNPVPVPDNDPDDCNGHGTHVAGIVGASGAVTGVAPRVTFGAYRVFGCDGSTDADIMIAAMERALADGMQVLNMSIGSAYQWPQYPTAQASDRLVNKGVVVVTSTGNSGANGLYSASAPGVGSKVIATASFDNTRYYLPFFTISPDDTRIGYNSATAAAPTPTSGTFSMARTGTTTSTTDACSPLAAGSLSGSVVLIRRGTCSFYLKSFHAQNAGALAVVLYNNLPGRISPTVASPTAADPPITIPVVSVSDTEGALINNRIAAGAVTMTWTAQSDFFNNVNTPRLISSFSSYGLAPDLSLKPDIGAPGGFIYSTYPLEKGGHASVSGTSMASPHVAGAAALLLEARPNTPSQAVRGILQAAADPRPWQGNPGLGFLDQVHRQGAGMLDIDDAILSATSITPSKLSLGESTAGPATHVLTIRNASDADVTYSLSHAPALSTNVATFAPGAFTTAASVTFADALGPITAVTVPARGSAVVNATIAIAAPAAAADRRIYGGYIVLTAGSGEISRVPYAGFRGDYQSIVAMPTTTVRAATTNPPVPALTVPAIGKLHADGTTFLGQSAGVSFSMTGGDIPYFLVHLDHAVRLMRIEIQDALTGTSWHRAGNFNYVGRNGTTAGFFALDWDGTTAAGKKQYTVPNGSYVAVLSVLKALGDAANPADWETWTSPMFMINRPAPSTTP